MKYNAWNIFREGLTGNHRWKEAWRKPQPKSEYDVIIVGGGGHGLATAYYLASKYGLNKVAVLEKGWIGGGNAGRNTTIVRSNYLLPGNQPFYELSLKLWENLEQELNYNVMMSQRGMLNLLHSDAQRDAGARRANAMLMSGADGELLTREEIQKDYPFLDFDNERFPIKAGLLQRRAGTARHDAVVWGYARAADQLGVEVIENCEVTGFQIEDGQCRGVHSTLGSIKAAKTAVCVAGSSGRVMALADMRLPIESFALQAFVTEGLKPVLPTAFSFGAGHFYVSQSDKGGLVFGGDLDAYNTYAQRGSLDIVQDVAECAVAVMPSIGRARLLRSWGGLMDMSMDGSPFIDETHVNQLFFNGGWCYGGFKATPASGLCYAHLLATGAPHEVAQAYSLTRTLTGAMIDEKGQGAHPNRH